MRFALALLLALSVLLVPTQSAYAASCSWTGSVSNDWHTAGNWSCNAVPGATDDVVVDVYNATISLNAAASIQSLKLIRGSVIGNAALNVSGLTLIDTGFATTLSTHGSHLPNVEIKAQATQVHLIDPALTSSSLQSLTVAGSAAFLAIGEHSVGTLHLVQHPLTGEWGVLRTDHNLTVTQSLQWGAGNLGFDFGNAVPPTTAQADLTIAPTATAQISGGSLISLNLINQGTLTFNTAFFSLTTGSTIQNTGSLLWQTSADSILNGSLPIINRGSLTKRGSGLLTLYPALHNQGILRLESSLRVYDSYEQGTGELQLAGGSLIGNNQFSFMNVRGGSISGSGTISMSVNLLAGRFAPTGPLTIAGNYTQSPTATLALDIAGLVPGSDFPVITVKPKLGIGGRATFNDSQLIINKVNGFQPRIGDRMAVMQCSLACQGSFSSTKGTLSPAFAGYAANNQLLITEQGNAILASSSPANLIIRSGSTHKPTIKFVNPTNQVITVRDLLISLPLGLSYVPGSSSGSLTSDPAQQSDANSRQLRWNASIEIPALSNRSFSFSMQASSPISAGSNDVLGLQLSTGAATLKYPALTPITIPLDAVSQIVSVPGSSVRLDSSTIPATLLAAKSQAATSGISLRSRIVCPFTSCGKLLNVYLLHGGKLFTMTAAPALQASLQSNDYGFWDGYISGPNVFPGEPTKIFPDWEDHRSCIYYDYGGGGGRPQGCVPNGDPGPTIQLYDPSGIIRDAKTGQAVAGATVTLLRIPAALPDTAGQTRDCRTVDTRSGGIWSGTAPNTGIIEDPGLQPQQISPQVNPQITGSDGRYGWNVVTGCWYVQVSAPGYANKTSALVGVPPEVTDLDILLEPGNGSGNVWKVFMPIVRP